MGAWQLRAPIGGGLRGFPRVVQGHAEGDDNHRVLKDGAENNVAPCIVNQAVQTSKASMLPAGAWERLRCGQSWGMAAICDGRFDATDAASHLD